MNEETKMSLCVVVINNHKEQKSIQTMISHILDSIDHQEYTLHDKYDAYTWVHNTLWEHDHK